MSARQESQGGENGESDWPGLGDMMRLVKSGDYPLSGPVESNKESIEKFIEDLLMPN
mgnify:FL=1